MKNFQEIVEKVKAHPVKKKIAAVAAHDHHTLEAINLAYKDGLLEPVLIGNAGEIKRLIDEQGFLFKEAEIIDVSDPVEASKTAVMMASQGKVEAIMKGNIQTADLLKQVVNREYGLKEADVLSHVAVFQMESYPKLFIMTDGGMIPQPDVRQKCGIIQNAVKVMNRLGVAEPKVAALAATEYVNPKIQSSIDAGELKRLNQEGVIKGCYVEGPIAYDLVVSKECAKIKGYDSPVVEDTDILLMPEMTSGNILAKTLMFDSGALMAGVVMGAKVPIVLVSRGGTAIEKYYSLALAAAVAE